MEESSGARADGISSPLTKSITSDADTQNLLHPFITPITPKRLFLFGRRTDANCPRCQGFGDLIHMVWRFPKLFQYWEWVIKTINKIFGTKLEMDPRLCVLGYRRVPGGGKSTTVAVVRCLFRAQKLIAQRWQSESPPISERFNLHCQRITMEGEGSIYTKGKR